MNVNIHSDGLFPVKHHHYSSSSIIAIQHHHPSSVDIMARSRSRSRAWRKSPSRSCIVIRPPPPPPPPLANIIGYLFETGVFGERVKVQAVWRRCHSAPQYWFAHSQYGARCKMEEARCNLVDVFDLFADFVLLHPLGIAMVRTPWPFCP